MHGDLMELIGYDLRGDAKNRGSYTITYYWKCLQTVPENYGIFVHPARSHDQKVVAWQDHALLGGSYPTYR